MRKNIRRLPDGELEVMQAIWACEPPVSLIMIPFPVPRNFWKQPNW